MRDYKLKQGNWPPRGQKRGSRTILWRLIGLATLLALAYALFDWFSAHPADTGVDANPDRAQQTDRHVIPLTIPPNRLEKTGPAASASRSAEGGSP